jgi:hypothetical protein
MSEVGGLLFMKTLIEIAHQLIEEGSKSALVLFDEYLDSGFVKYALRGTFTAIIVFGI